MIESFRNCPPPLLRQVDILGRDCFGQKVDDHVNGVPGSWAVSDDPAWNTSADPRWSSYGTRVVFYQVQTTLPACGGADPLPCYPSKEPGMGSRDEQQWVDEFKSWAWQN